MVYKKVLCILLKRKTVLLYSYDDVFRYKFDKTIDRKLQVFL